MKDHPISKQCEQRDSILLYALAGGRMETTYKTNIVFGSLKCNATSLQRVCTTITHVCFLLMLSVPFPIPNWNRNLPIIVLFDSIFIYVITH